MTAGGTSAVLPMPRRGRSGVAGFLHRHQTMRGYLLVSPALVVTAAAILMPLATIVLTSFWSVSGYTIDQTLTLQNYQAMTEQPMYGVLIGRSLWVAAVATLLTVALCYPMAYFVAFHVHRHKALWLIIMTLPFWTSYLLCVFSWKVVLGYEGVINTALLGLGLIEQPLTFTISFNEFILAFFLGGTEATLPMYIWSQLRFPQDFPSLLALATLILVFSFVMVFASLKIGGFGQVRRGGAT